MAFVDSDFANKLTLGSVAPPPAMPGIDPGGVSGYGQAPAQTPEWAAPAWAGTPQTAPQEPWSMVDFSTPEAPWSQPSWATWDSGQYQPEQVNPLIPAQYEDMPNWTGNAPWEQFETSQPTNTGAFPGMLKPTWADQQQPFQDVAGQALQSGLGLDMFNTPLSAVAGTPENAMAQDLYQQARADIFGRQGAMAPAEGLDFETMLQIVLSQEIDPKARRSLEKFYRENPEELQADANAALRRMGRFEDSNALTDALGIGATGLTFIGSGTGAANQVGQAFGQDWNLDWHDVPGLDNVGADIIDTVLSPGTLIPFAGGAGLKVATLGGRAGLEAAGIQAATRGIPAIAGGVLAADKVQDIPGFEDQPDWLQAIEPVAAGLAGGLAGWHSPEILKNLEARGFPGLGLKDVSDNYVYHITNRDRAIQIKETGELRPHEPWDFTEQDTWPDSSTNPRSYFSSSPNLEHFAPPEGEPVLLRKQLTPDVKEERWTGDLYSERASPAAEIEFRDVDGTWRPLSDIDNRRSMLKKPTEPTIGEAIAPGPDLAQNAAQREALDALHKETVARRSGETASIIHEGRISQVQRFNEAFEEGQARGLAGEDLSKHVLGNMRGQLRTVDPLSPETYPMLHNLVHTAFKGNEITEFEAASLTKSLIEWETRGLAPTPGVQKTMRRLFGDEFVDSYFRPRKLKVEAPDMPYPTRALPGFEGQAPVQPPFSEATLTPGGLETSRVRVAGEIANEAARKEESYQAWLNQLRASEAARGGTPLKLGDEALIGAGPVKGKYPSVLPTRPPPVHSLTPGRILYLIKESALEVLALARATKTSLDISAPGRQGLPLGLAHPILAKDAFVKQIKALVSEKAFLRSEAALDARPNARIHRESGLFRADMAGGDLTKAEEAFLSRIAGHIPLIRGSQRAYVAYLNNLRANVFDHVWAALDPLDRTIENGKTLARFINVASGRGELGGILEGSGTFLGRLLFSPRNLVSKPEMIYLGGKLAATGPNAMKREASRVMAAYFGGISSFLAMGVAAGLWDVEVDPRSADFGKLRVGNTRYDLWGGYSQLVRTMTRMATGETKSTRTGEIYDVNRLTDLLGFTRAKLAPVPGELVNQLQGKDFLGNPAERDPFHIIWNLYGPLSPQDVFEGYQDNGWMGALMAIPSIFGVGTQTYAPTPQEQYDAKLIADPDFGKPLSQLSESKRKAAEEKFGPKPLSRDEDVAARQIQARIHKMETAAWQEAIDRQLEDGTLTPEQWREQRQTRITSDRGFWEGLYATAPEFKGVETPVTRYYAAIDAATEPVTKVVDWDRVAAYEAGLSEADRKYIAENTGLNYSSTEQGYKTDLAKIEASGYFETEESKSAFRKAHPEIDALVRKWGYGASTTKILDLEKELSGQQDASDLALKAGQIDGDQWRDDLHSRMDQLRGAKEAIFSDLTEREEGPLSGWFAAIEQATDKQGHVDWDEVDAWLQAQPKETRAAVEGRVRTFLSDPVARYYEATGQADETGYFDLKEKAWSDLKTAYPGRIDDDLTYEDWYEGQVQALVEAGVAYGYDAREARQRAILKLDSNATVQRVAEITRTQYRHRWVVENPQLAKEMWFYGLFTPDVKEREFLAGIR